jgi:hypothetical protein
MTGSIRRGVSVRRFFQEDLQTLATRGSCLLPEWICESMVEAVRAAHWQPCFYPVLPPSRAEVFLQADFEQLRVLGQKRDSAVALLLAHPMGYVDPGCADFLSDMEHESELACFLDWSQGYGMAPLDRSIDHIHAAYLSFNGNKLVDTGGALRLSSPGRARIRWPCFQREARRKRARLQRFLRANHLEQSITLATLYAEHQSSPMRTALDWKALPRKAQVQLLRQGMVQPLLAEPRIQGSRASDAYRQWQERVMLMFHAPRNEWKSHA